MDARLVDILICPVCQGPLRHRRGPLREAGQSLDGELVCERDALAYPIRDGIEVLLVDEARRLNADPADAPAPDPLPDLKAGRPAGGDHGG